MFTPFVRILLICLLSPLTLSCSNGRDNSASVHKDKVSVQLKWCHQAQFAGFYAAEKKGYYRDENLDVALLEGGASVDHAAALLNGTADFAVLSPESLLGGQSGARSLTAISILFRKSAVAYLVKTGSGIGNPYDFMGKTVSCKDSAGSVKDFELQFMAMMNRLDIPLDSIRMVPFEPDFKGIIHGTVDVTPTYFINGAVRLKRKGLKYMMIWPDDYGVHCFSDTLVTTTEMIEKKPDLVFRFLRATLRGWRFAVGNPEEAVEITLPYVKKGDRELQNEMMNALIPLVHTGENRIGWMCDKDWSSFIRLLEDQNLLKKGRVEPGKAYTTRFLNQVYGVGNP